MTDEQKEVRKLRAILSADVKGYSLLMADDESSTVKKLKECLESMSALTQSHSGRVVDAVGDNLLAEFSSAVDAVQCAVEIQKDLKEKNDTLPESKRIEFRIGINIGDVIQEGGRIHGSGVNVAARIEGLAEPGGICISRNAFDHIKEKLSFGYEYLGDHEVKNIKDPVRIYKVLMDPEDAGKLIGQDQTVSASKWIWPTVVVAAVIVTLTGYHVYQKIAGPKFARASVERMAFALPEKPSIAVLPFDNMGGDPEQGYLCDGITEQIITSFSKISGLFVIARNSSFSFKGKAVKVQQVAEELGVRYVLEGSVQKSGQKVRVTAQLIDAIKGNHIWAETYDRELQEAFALQDEITLRILSAVGAELTQGERARVYGKGTNSLAAYSKVVKGYEHFQRQGKEENILARKLAREAIALDPNYPSAYSLLGGTYLMDPFSGSTKSAKKSWNNAVEAFQKALALDETHAPSHGGLAMVYGFQRKYKKALVQAQRGIDLNPGFPIMHTGYVLVFVGRYEEAVRYFNKAIRQDPKAPTFYYNGLGHAYRALKRYEDSIKAYKKALEREPDYLIGHYFLASTYSLAGLEEEARAEAAEVLRLQPKFSVGRIAKVLPYQDKDFLNRTIEGMRRAGLPDKPPLPLPDKPSIAVFAFDNLSGDPKQEYFSDGIAENVIIALSKIDKLFVIARNSSFSYRDMSVRVQQVSRELGVKYVLKGSVQKSSDRVRISAQLIDATTGHHLWAERYDRDLHDIFELQDQITLKIVTALQVELTEGEQARLWGQKTENLDFLLKSMEARSYFNKGSKESYRRFAQIGQEMIQLAPESPEGYRILGWVNWLQAMRGKSDSIEKAFNLAQKALSLDESYAPSHSVLGNVYLLMRQFDKAIASGKRAVELDPNGAMYHGQLGMTLSFAGRPDEAIVYLKQGIRLNPFPEFWYYTHLSRCYWQKGQYEKALSECKKALQLSSDSLSSRITLTAIYAFLDRHEEAQAAANKVLEIKPDFSIRHTSKNWPYKKHADYQFLIDALSKAGLPD